MVGGHIEKRFSLGVLPVRVVKNLNKFGRKSKK